MRRYGDVRARMLLSNLISVMINCVSYVTTSKANVRLARVTRKALESNTRMYQKLNSRLALEHRHVPKALSESFKIWRDCPTDSNVSEAESRSRPLNSIVLQFLSEQTERVRQAESRELNDEEPEALNFPTHDSVSELPGVVTVPVVRTFQNLSHSVK